MARVSGSGVKLKLKVVWLLIDYSLVPLGVVGIYSGSLCYGLILVVISVLLGMNIGALLAVLVMPVVRLF